MKAPRQRTPSEQRKYDIQNATESGNLEVGSPLENELKFVTGLIDAKFRELMAVVPKAQSLASRLPLR